jgi:hypothetical protein
MEAPQLQTRTTMPSGTDSKAFTGKLTRCRSTRTHDPAAPQLGCLCQRRRRRFSTRRTCRSACSRATAGARQGGVWVAMASCRLAAAAASAKGWLDKAGDGRPPAATLNGAFSRCWPRRGPGGARRGSSAAARPEARRRKATARAWCRRGTSRCMCRAPIGDYTDFCTAIHSRDERRGGCCGRTTR